MPSAADHFTALVARLADPGSARPRDRPGLERIARAVAGESLARFRGRILLERAAYLALTTDRTLLDIALDSGARSQEVFTRAFRREHGVLPSVWRAEPTSWRTDAPGDVHVHPPVGLRLPARHRMDGVDLVIEMVQHHVRLVGGLVERAGLVPDAELDRASTGSVNGHEGRNDHSLRWALTSLVDQLELFGQVVHDVDVSPDVDVGVDPGVERRESLTSLRGRLDRAGPAFVDDVSRLASTGRLDEAVVDAFSPTPKVLSYGAMVAHVLTFAPHQRLLALARLRECGVADLDFADPQHWFAAGRRPGAG